MPNADSSERRTAPASPLPLAQYLILAAFFLLVAAQQTRFFIDLASDLRLHYGSAWISLGPPWPTVQWAGGPAAAAGLKPGDRVLAINGQPPRGSKDLARWEQQLGPGKSIDITVVRSSGNQASAPSTIPVVLRATRSYMNPKLWLFAAVVWVALPLLCIALGFGVAVIRPRDPLAWLLLALLMGLVQNVTTGNVDPAGWGDWIRDPAIVYRSLVGHTWPIWMLLFGLAFPQPLLAEKRIWWLKWLLLLGPLALIAVAVTARQLILTENYAALAGWGESVAALEPWSLRLGILSVTLFFTVLFAKAYTPSIAPDARRRVRLLIVGSVLSLTPAFVLLVVGQATHREFRNGLPLLVSLMMMFLLPVTLAYLVVVDRALDVRVVVRQGVQYALASGSVRVMQIVLTLVVAFTAERLLNNPDADTAERLEILATSIAAVLLMRRGIERLRGWVDRRFFREAYRAEQILGDLLAEVHHVVETRPLLETVARRIADSMHVARVTMLVREGNTFAPVYAIGGSDGPLPAFPIDDPAVRRLESTRQPVRLTPSASTTANSSDSAGWRVLDADLLLPLPAREQMLGVISLGPKRSEVPYSGADLKLLQSVARQTGLALENSRMAEQIATEAARRERLSRELEIAREVQHRLLPQKQPHVPGLAYAGTCRPALEVGGDYYDFLALPNGEFGVAIGDVSGKGVPAAMLMAALQAGLRGQTVDGVTDLSRLMSNLNRVLYDSTPRNHFATFFYAQFNPVTRDLRYSNAGHNPPVLLRGEQVIPLVTCGPGLGLSRVSRYRSEHIALAPGDCVVLFTDGLPEAMNPAREEWTDVGLYASAQASRGAPGPAEAVDSILADAARFADGAPQHDDMTLVVLRVLAEGTA